MPSSSTRTWFRPDERKLILKNVTFSLAQHRPCWRRRLVLLSLLSCSEWSLILTKSRERDHLISTKMRSLLLIYHHNNLSCWGMYLRTKNKSVSDFHHDEDGIRDHVGIFWGDFLSTCSSDMIPRHITALRGTCRGVWSYSDLSLSSPRRRKEGKKPPFFDAIRLGWGALQHTSSHNGHWLLDSKGIIRPTLFQILAPLLSPLSLNKKTFSFFFACTKRTSKWQTVFASCVSDNVAMQCGSRHLQSSTLLLDDWNNLISFSTWEEREKRERRRSTRFFSVVCATVGLLFLLSGRISH